MYLNSNASRATIVAAELAEAGGTAVLPEAEKPTPVQQAAACYIARQQRNQHPAGKFDKAGRWEPSESERCDCCAAIRTPSRAYKYGLMVHCRTMAHIANLYGVAIQDVRRAVREIESK